jgi:hypothetical protein
MLRNISLDYLNPAAVGSTFFFMIIPGAILLAYMRFLDATNQLPSKNLMYALLTFLLIFAPLLSLISVEDDFFGLSTFPKLERPLSSDANFLAAARTAAASFQSASSIVIARRFSARIIDTIVLTLVLYIMQTPIEMFIYEFLPAADPNNIRIEYVSKSAFASICASTLMVAVFFAIDGAVYGLKKTRSINFSRGVANMVVLVTLLVVVIAGFALLSPIQAFFFLLFLIISYPVLIVVIYMVETGERISIDNVTAIFRASLPWSRDARTGSND